MAWTHTHQKRLTIIIETIRVAMCNPECNCYRKLLFNSSQDGHRKCFHLNTNLWAINRMIFKHSSNRRDTQRKLLSEDDDLFFFISTTVMGIFMWKDILTAPANHKLCEWINFQCHLGETDGQYIFFFFFSVMWKSLKWEHVKSM